MKDTLEQLQRNLIVAKRLPPVVRVRRRGFPRDVRRGFDLRRRDGIYRVIRRSNWSLWLEKVADCDGKPLFGDTVRIRTPRRVK